MMSLALFQNLLPQEKEISSNNIYTLETNEEVKTLEENIFLSRFVYDIMSFVFPHHQNSVSFPIENKRVDLSTTRTSLCFS